MIPVKHPITTDVVLVGAGHAHVAVLRMAAMKPVPGVRYTLVTREADGALSISYKPVTITKFEPKERVY